MIEYSYTSFTLKYDHDTIKHCYSEFNNSF